MGAGYIDEQGLRDEFTDPIQQPSARFLIDRAIIDDDQPHRKVEKAPRDQMAGSSQSSIFQGARTVALTSAVSSLSDENRTRIGVGTRKDSPAGSEAAGSVLRARRGR